MHMQDDRNLCILCMFKGIFSLEVVHIMYDLYIVGSTYTSIATD